MTPLTWQIGDVHVTRTVEHPMASSLHDLLADATPESVVEHRHGPAADSLDDGVRFEGDAPGRLHPPPG